MNSTSIPDQVTPAAAPTPVRWRAIWPVTTDGSGMTSRTLVAEAAADLPDVAARHRYEVVGVERWGRCPGRLVPGSGGAHEVIVAECWVLPATRPADPPWPDITSAHPVQSARVNLLEELAEQGATWPEAARRAGARVQSLKRSLQRAGRGDVIATITATTDGPPCPVPSHPEQYRRTA